MYVWKNIYRLIDRFAKPITYNIIEETYSPETGEPVHTSTPITILASIQPVKKKGAIGGENEIFLNVEPTGNWETGAFIMISKSNFHITMQDEIKDLTINNINYGDAFIDRIQDWSDNLGLYKVRVLLKSIYPTRESYSFDDEY